VRVVHQHALVAEHPDHLQDPEALCWKPFSLPPKAQLCSSTMYTYIDVKAITNPIPRLISQSACHLAAEFRNTAYATDASACKSLKCVTFIWLYRLFWATRSCGYSAKGLKCKYLCFYCLVGPLR
jgi:hypothetical protein